MEWFNVVKRRRKNMQGNIPHFYHWLTRVQRKRHEHTEAWLKKYCAWEELPNEVKEYMKRYYLDTITGKTGPNAGGWGRRGVTGIELKWDNLDFTVDEQLYNNWRINEAEPSSRVSWMMSNRMNNVYRSVMDELKNCRAHSMGQGGNRYSYLSRYYKEPSKKPYHNPSISSVTQGALNK